MKKSSFYANLFDYFAKPFARKKKFSSMEKILMFEESKAEIVIAKIRIVLLACVMFFSLFQNLSVGTSFITKSTIPQLIFLLFSTSLFFKLSVISSKVDFLEKYYFPITKYIIILYDSIFFTWLIHTFIKKSDVNSWGVISLYTLFFAFLIITDIFRYDIITSIFCGIVTILSKIILSGFNEAILSPFILVKGGVINIQNILFLLSIILFTFLSCMISRHIRMVILKSKKQDNLEKYVPEIVAREIMSSKKELSLNGVRGNVTILFSDIRNFTTISEKLSPEEVILFLNEYFDIMINVLFKHKGTLDKLIGDGLMAIFGSPFLDESNPEQNAMNAVDAAIQMKSELVKLNNSLIKKGLNPIQIGIGINSGEAVLGNIGTEKRTEFTAIGDVVNTASRIEGHTKDVSKSILISKHTKEFLRDKYEVVSLGEVELKGKDNKVELFSLGKQVNT